MIKVLGGIPAKHAWHFPQLESHLERYAQRFAAVEINTSFCRSRRQSTYQLWAATVPNDFALAVRAPRSLRLAETDEALDGFLAQASGLGAKLAPLLCQLPPSLAFDASLFRVFCTALRARFNGSVASRQSEGHDTWVCPQW